MHYPKKLSFVYEINTIFCKDIKYFFLSLCLFPGIKWHFVTTYQNNKHLNDLTLSYVYIFELGIERKQARLKTETVHLNSRYVHKYVKPIALLRKWWQIFCFFRISLLLSRQRAVVSSLITMYKFAPVMLTFNWRLLDRWLHKVSFIALKMFCHLK